MRNIGIICRKELTSYLNSPMAYIVTAIFLALSGTFFASYLAGTNYTDTSIRGFLNAAQILILLFAAVLTMRLVAEEKKQGTWEFLLTAPLKDGEIIMGKFLGSLGVLIGMLFLTLYYPLLLAIFGDPDFGPIATSYLGLVLLGSACLSVGVFASTLSSNQIVSAVALNIGTLGLSSTLFALIFARGEHGVVEEVIKVPSMEVWKIPLLGDIPVIGEIFFSHLPLVYFAFLIVPLIWFVLYRTTWGLKIRAVGEHPHAADTVGISVVRVRYLSLAVTGMMSGLAGAFLSIGQLNMFQENMSAGRGFIAYTAIVFGKWEPLGVFLGTLLFGLADALQLRIQALNLDIPYQFLVAFPYVVTLVVLVIFVGKASWPAASGLPFKREER